jgi:hypothetical protein
LDHRDLDLAVSAFWIRAKNFVTLATTSKKKSASGGKRSKHIKVKISDMNIAANSGNGNNGDLTILDMAHLLERNPKERSKYICPVCGGHNLSINAKTGKYDCYDDPTPAHRSEIFITLLKEYQPIDGWSDQQREEQRHKSTVSKAKKKAKAAVDMAADLAKGKFTDPDPFLGFETATRVEMKVAWLADLYDPSISTCTELKLINDLEGWCKESGVNAFNPVRMLKEAIAARTAVPEVEDYEAEDYQRTIGRSARSIDFGKLLNPKLARLIKATAATLPVNPECTYLHYRSVMASIVGTRAKLVIRPGWTQGLTCWTAVLADPGSKKSPSLDKLTAPLVTLQEESQQEYERDLKDYTIAMRLWEKESKSNPDLQKPEEPSSRDWFVVDSTMEALAPMLRDSPHKGVVAVYDELAGWFGGMDAYRSNSGDRANWLSLMGGKSLKVNRKDKAKNIFVKHTAVSITGATHADTLDRMMRDSKDKNDGLWDRFRFAFGQFVSIRDRGPAWDSDPHFLQLYRNLDAMPERLYQLSPEAERLFFDFECWVEDQRSKVSKRMYAALNKCQWKLGVEILALHLEDSAIEGDLHPEALVPRETVERALEAINYDIMQIRMLHDRMVDQVLDKRVFDAIDLAKKNDGTITPRQMQIARLCKTAAEANELIDQMLAKNIGVEEWPTSRKRVFRYTDGGGSFGADDGFIPPIPEPIVAPVEPETPQFDPKEQQPLPEEWHVLPGEYVEVVSALEATCLNVDAPNLSDGDVVMVVRFDAAIATVMDLQTHENHEIPIAALAKTEHSAKFSCAIT